MVNVEPRFWIEEREFNGALIVWSAMFPMTPGWAALAREMGIFGFRVERVQNESPMTVGTIVVGARPR